MSLKANSRVWFRWPWRRAGGLAVCLGRADACFSLLRAVSSVPGEQPPGSRPLGTFPSFHSVTAFLRPAPAFVANMTAVAPGLREIGVCPPVASRCQRRLSSPRRLKSACPHSIRKAPTLTGQTRALLHGTRGTAPTSVAGDGRTTCLGFRGQVTRPLPHPLPLLAVPTPTSSSKCLVMSKFKESEIDFVLRISSCSKRALA